MSERGGRPSPVRRHRCAQCAYPTGGRPRPCGRLATVRDDSLGEWSYWCEEHKQVDVERNPAGWFYPAGEEARMRADESPQNPQTPDEWQEAVNAAEALLRLDAARQYGLVTGGPEVNVARCRELIHLGRTLGYRPHLD